METKTLLKKLGKKFPKSLSEPWDHPLKQVGNIKNDTKTILLCLDFDEIVYDFMEKNELLDKVDLIITHHPFIFGTFKKVIDSDEHKKELVLKLNEHNLCIYSYHTNFDTAKDGMNDALAARLELVDVKPLVNDKMARGGRLKEPMEVEEFSKYVKNKFNASYGLLLPYGKKIIESCAIIGGGGSSTYKAAQEEGYDIFISGDNVHHRRREIIADKYNYLDLPHEIERIFMEQMKNILLSIDPSLNIITFDHEIEPKVI